MSKLMFPTAKIFGDLFPVYTSQKGMLPVIPWEFEDYDAQTGNKKMSTIYIGPSITVRPDFHSFYAQPKDAVVRAIKENMIPVDENDRISFEIIVRDLNDALVLAKYNIVNSACWLSIIDPRSIPSVGRTIVHTYTKRIEHETENA